MIRVKPSIIGLLKGKGTKADIAEVFSSRQGEGLFLGARQIFIRFAGCNLNCSFCDTRKNIRPEAVGVSDLIRRVRKINNEMGVHHSVSLTGGEPLCYAAFLRFLLPELKKNGFKTYLETNGTLCRELEVLIEHIDIIAMDIKLPSSTGMPPLWDQHKAFLEIARKKNLFVKAVITDGTSEEDLITARGLLEGVDRELLFILQPASAAKDGEFMVDKEKLIRCREIAEERLKNVRIICQTHKFLGIR